MQTIEQSDVEASAERYDRLAADLLARYRARPSRTARWLWSSLDAASAALALEGSASAEHAQALRECAARDLAHLASVLVRGTRADVAMAVAVAGSPGALRALLETLRLSGDAVFRLAGPVGAPEMRRAGEVTCAGGLRCAGCGSVHGSRCSLVVAPCHRCGHAEFHKLLGN